jgi:protease IV
MTVDSVHQIAQGRVWVGEKAKQIGLVDEIGDLERGLALAAELSGLENYRLVEYPKQMDPIQELINEFTGQGEDNGIQSRAMERELSEIYPNYKQVKSWLKMEGVQARLPVILNFK